MENESNTSDARPNELELASRWLRFFATLIDGVIVTALSVPLILYFDIWSIMRSGGQVSLGVAAAFFIWNCSLFVAINYWLLNNRGQTIGKWLLDIAIVGTDGTNKGAFHLLVYRYLPVWVIPQVPFVGTWLSLMDVLFIFRKDRRCIHDLIAGTKVVNLETAPGWNRAGQWAE